jgi:hypothetical protein
MIIMNTETQARCRSLAAHFYKTRINGSPTAKKVSDALKNCACEYRPDYWRSLRIALAFVAKEHGFYKAADHIAATKNPITSDSGRRSEIKKKQNRQKSVSQADEKQLLDYLVHNKESVTFAAVTLVSYLGCRPAELKHLVFQNDQTILIPSAKKTEKGNRGLDRVIHIKEARLFNSLKTSHEMFLTAPCVDPTRYVQRRLEILTTRLWPKRNVRPSLYSWRHQMGSDLKASDMNSAEIAAIMGHRSTDSVDVYGNRRSARNTRSYLTPTREIVKQVKKINRHRLLKQPGKRTTFGSISDEIRKKFGSRSDHKTRKP